jgi:predicted transcriptional regulator
MTNQIFLDIEKILNAEIKSIEDVLEAAKDGNREEREAYILGLKRAKSLIKGYSENY